MLQFRCVVLPEQSCGSSTGQGETASVERPVATGRLQNDLSLRDETRGNTTNVSSCSNRLTLREVRLRIQVSTGDICSPSDTYPNPLEYRPSTLCHLNKQIVKKMTLNM